MIYVDTSVLLARLFAEDRFPGDDFWRQALVSSRLIEYETWSRVNARGMGRTHGEAARDFLSRLAFVELLPTVLARAIEPFPVPVRTLDALHLASAHFLKTRDRRLFFATYDDSLGVAARALNLKVISP